MSTPVIQSVGSTNTNTSNSATTSAPSGTAAGDLLVLCFAMDTTTSVSTPAGWTLLKSGTDGIGVVGTAIYGRIADGSGTDTPTLSLGASVFWFTVILRVTGQSGSYFDVGGTHANTVGSSFALPTITTTLNNDLLIAIVACDSSTITGNPSGYSTQASGSGTANSRVYSKSADTAGSYGGETGTVSGSVDSSSTLVALNGAATIDQPEGANCGL